LVLKVLLQDIRKLETEAVIVGFFEDVRPLKGLAGELDWLLCGTLSDLIASGKLRGSLGDVALLTSKNKIPAQKIFMIGLGRSQELSPALLRSVARTAAASALGAGITSAALEYFPAAGLEPAASIRALRNGLQDGAGTQALDVALLVPDAVSYEKVSKLAAAR
jgi:hypothetical protein